MGKIGKGRIKNYLKEVKDETKNFNSKEEENDKNFNKMVTDDFREEFMEERRSLVITSGAIVGIIILIVIIGFIFYFVFHKRIEKKLNEYIDNIPVYSSSDPNNTGTNNNSNTPDNSGNNSSNSNNQNSGKGCSKPFDGTYKLGIEEITFMDDGFYDKSINGVTSATGFYTINNSTITVDVTYEDYTLGNTIISYSISSDCKKVSELGTGKLFVRSK